MSNPKDQDALFPPFFRYSTGWTTSPLVNNPNILHVALSDSALGVHRVTARLTHDVVHSPNLPKHNPQDLAWEAAYPKGSINPGGKIRGGFGFYLHGPQGFAEKLRGAQEAMFSYSVLFESGWEWVKGGKLPGACKRLLEAG
jgi:hypothetical protein